MSVQSDIHLGILAYISASSLTNVAYPNVKADLDKPFFRINFLPVPTIPLAVNETNRYSGILQIDVNIEEGIGQVKADTEVNKLFTLFPRGTTITQNGNDICFDRAGWISPPQQSGDNYFIPVNFFYQVLAKE